MSEQHNPARDSSSDEQRARKLKKNRAEKLLASDYKVGQLVVAEHRDSRGFQSFYRIRILDAYEGASFSRWSWGALDQHVYGRITAVSVQSDSKLLGHITRVSLETSSSWNFHRAPVMTPYTEKDLVNMGRPWAAEVKREYPLHRGPDHYAYED